MSRCKHKKLLNCWLLAEFLAKATNVCKFNVNQRSSSLPINLAGGGWAEDFLLCEIVFVVPFLKMFDQIMRFLKVKTIAFN